MLDPDVGQLHYFVSEQGKSQKPRGSLPLVGASVTQSDEAPHMFVVHSVSGELYKLRGKPSSTAQALSVGSEVIPWKSYECGICGSTGMLLVGQNNSMLKKTLLFIKF